MHRVILILCSLLCFASLLLWNFQFAEIANLFRSEAILPAIQLFLAALFFSLVGLLATLCVRIKISSLIWAILIGQVLCMLWVYLRSGLSLLTKIYLDFYLPLSVFDLIPLLIIAYFVLNKSAEVNINSRSLYKIALQAAPILLICWISAQRELPRLSMLSSDPDLHVFWAVQIKRLGTIPESLGLWGPEGLRYPAGFAVLNYLWSIFSFLDLQQIVSVQSLIQSQLAILLIASVSSYLTKFKDFSDLLQFGICIFLISSFYFLLPYGYQNNFYHLEGTARSSCLFLLAAMCLSFAILFFDKNKISPAYLSLMASTSVLLIGINPINALYCGPAFVLVILASLWKCFVQKQRISLLNLLWPLILLCDPYFYSDSPLNNSLSAAPVSIFDSLKNGLLRAAAQPLNLLGTAINCCVKIDFYSASETWKLIVVLLIIYLALRRFQDQRRMIEILTVVFACIVIIILAFVIIPGLQPLSTSSQYRLLYPYSLHLSEQLIYLLVFFLLSLVSFRLFSLGGINLLLVLAIPLMLIFREMRDDARLIRMEPRFTVKSGLGSPTDDDLQVIRQIESLTQKVLIRYPKLTASNIPKILVPNFMSDFGWEKWLFPYGGSRILALHNVFPLAFYYNQGWQEFSYENYRKKICHHLDIAWLKQRNIRYLFLPSERGPICVRGLKQLLMKDMILFKSGDSLFIKLFDSESGD